LIVFLRQPPTLAFIEMKSEVGTLTLGQRVFRDQCVAAGVVHVHGTAATVADWLKRCGFVR
jgi:hypothetical protein